MLFSGLHMHTGEAEQTDLWISLSCQPSLINKPQITVRDVGDIVS